MRLFDSSIVHPKLEILIMMNEEYVGSVLVDIGAGVLHIQGHWWRAAAEHTEHARLKAGKELLCN